jgi:general stress protein YciG
MIANRPNRTENLEKEIAMTNTQHRGGSGNFAEDRQRASEAGQKGGQQSSGNFKNDPQRAAEAGHRGGQQSGGNFKNDPQRAAEADREGGRH